MEEFSVKSLVVYYSRTGSTKFVAQAIASELGADLEEVVDHKKREGKLGWIVAGKDSTQEKQTEIAPTVHNIADYDLIVVGTPIWAWKPTPAIRTYVTKNSLAGKKVALFFVMDASIKQAAEKTKELITGAVFVGELVLPKAMENKEETKKKVAEWCSSLKSA
jgi:flavodoxin